MTDPDQPPIIAWLAALSPELGVVARAWATVDLDRAVLEAGPVDSAWGEAVEPVLGARGKRSTIRGIAILLLEPSTEGPLAGYLARHGEGEAVVYRRAPAGEGSSSRLVSGGRFGPFVIEVGE